MKAVTGEGIAVTGRRCYYYSRHFIDDSQPIISSICQGGPLLLEKQETPANHSDDAAPGRRVENARRGD
jgi:hypothetical protein